MKILITGGAGFIGSHLVDYFVENYNYDIVVLDNMGYAANFENIKYHIENKSIKFILGDITNYAIYSKIFPDTDLVIHTAAESHVDNSFFDPWRFVKTNVEGTQLLLQACKEYGVSKVIHFSTDEVYGDTKNIAFTEDSALNPTNPYSASKAGADMMIAAYRKSFKLDVTIVRPNNVFGIRQHWEKLIPTCVLHLKQDKKIPIHGEGLNKRSYLYIEDLCKAIDLIRKAGGSNATYNIGCNFEYKVLDIVKLICETAKVDFKEHIEFVEDRLYNDTRYLISHAKLAKLGWRAEIKLEHCQDSLFNWFYKQRAPFAHGWFKND